MLGPGGYGKSTLVARWMDAEVRSVLWFDAESIDNDPVMFADAVIGALSAVDPVVFAAMPSAPSGTHGFTDRLIPAIGHAIRNCNGDFVLVIDDVHVIGDPDAAAILDAIATNLPSESTLVLSGRAHRFEHSIARLRLDPGVIDIDASTLALNVDESRQLLLAMGVDVELVNQVPTEQFEGWPAGLRLAGLLLDSKGASGALDSITQVTFITDYLRAEWTNSLGDHDLQFLREAACLRRFTAEMCSDVLDRTGAAEMLRHLQRDVQLVLPLDQRGQWFRMHPILADWLEGELRDAQPRRWAEVHRRAAEWWEQHGDIDLAIDHAAVLDDVDRCEQLITTNAAAHFPLGGHTTVRRWLERLPEDRVRRSASLTALATMAALHTGDGDRARRWNLNLSELVGDASAARDVNHEPSMIAESIRATIDVRPTEELIESARRAHDHLPNGPWRVNSSMVLGANLFMAGDENCVEVWEHGALEAELVGARLLVAHCLAGSAVARDLDGDLAAAIERGRRVQMITRTTNATLLPPMVLAVSAGALVEARDGRHDAAAEQMAIACRHLDGFRSVAPWINTLARLALVRTALIIDDRPASRRLLRDAEQFALQPGDARGALHHVEALRRQIDAVASMSLDRAGSLTPAERRVLAYLPTNLSLADIATLLIVSRNTVKSHAAAIYRKLGTTSRREAVELARQAGLLDGAGPDALR